MTVNIQSELFRTAVSTFEDLGFMFLQPETDEDSRNSPVEAVVSVTFEGPVRGSLFLAVYGNLLPTLVANMLGEDGAFSNSQLCDALGEIANVICGNFIPLMAGRTSVFRISSPRVVKTEEWMCCMGDPSIAQVRVLMEKGYADLMLTLERDI